MYFPVPRGAINVCAQTEKEKKNNATEDESIEINL
jgi:hypothetical protein